MKKFLFVARRMFGGGRGILWAVPVVDIKVPKFKPITDSLSNGPSALSDILAKSNPDLGAFLQQLFTIAISVGAILAVLRIAYGGFVYMTTDALTDKKKSREILQNAVLGLVLLLAIIIILERINPNLLNTNLFLAPAPATPATSNAGSFARPLEFPGSVPSGQ